MTAKLDGPRRPARSGRADSLVVLLHGYGASGDDLIGLADVWARDMPHTAFAAPHAIERMPYAGMAGYQWFDLSVRDPQALARGALGAVPAITAFLEAECARCRVDAGRLALAGFSQGTMMALAAAPALARPPAAIVGFSGLLAAPLRKAEPTPPVLLVHGDQDDVIPVDALHGTREALAQTGYCVMWHERPGLGHGIDEDGLRIAGQFLAENLASRA